MAPSLFHVKQKGRRQEKMMVHVKHCENFVNYFAYL